MYKIYNTVYCTKGIYSLTEKSVNVQVNCILNTSTEHISFSTSYKYRPKTFGKKAGKLFYQKKRKVNVEKGLEREIDITVQ